MTTSGTPYHDVFSCRLVTGEVQATFQTSSDKPRHCNSNESTVPQDQR